jgi:hypothetical protein
MALQNIILVIVALIFGLLYLYEDHIEKNKLARDIFMIACLGFMFGALAFNFDVSKASSIITTANSVVTYANTTYTYSNSVIPLGPALISYMGIFFTLLMLMFYRFYIDYMEMTKETIHSLGGRRGN